MGGIKRIREKLGLFVTKRKTYLPLFYWLLGIALDRTGSLDLAFCRMKNSFPQKLYIQRDTPISKSFYCSADDQAR